MRNLKPFKPSKRHGFFFRILMDSFFNPLISANKSRSNLPHFFLKRELTFITLFACRSLYYLTFLRVVSRRRSTKEEKK